MAGSLYGFGHTVDMWNDADACYRALEARDARFDGSFFTGVKTTGIFCRPVCPARTPLRKNCRFFPSAAAALDAGFRPCLRCRPETAPDTPAWLGVTTTVHRALRLINEGALDGGSVDTLAARLGVGGRHLRRLFHEHLGASPLAVAQARRVLFAKRLIQETGLPLEEVAFAAGFASTRRFHAALSEAYRMSPRELRRARGAVGGRIDLTIPITTPYHWDGIVGFLGARAIPGVESVTADRYRRTVRLREVTGTIEVRRPNGAQLPVSVELPDLSALRETIERIGRIFDVNAATGPVRAAIAELDPPAGIRVPGAWDPFELMVRAVLGQQISVAAATTFAGRIAEQFGESLPGGGDTSRIFPAASKLASVDLRKVGLTAARAGFLQSLAGAVAAGRLRFEGYAGLDEAVTAMCEFDGIGPWTAHYIAMRALREPDAFPATDLALEKAGGADVAKRAERWRPWRAYAAMTLWEKHV